MSLLCEKEAIQPVCNIGTAGHVDHGKTTLVWALSNVWTTRHSEELARGMTIKLGYADTVFRKCPICPPPQCYTINEVCSYCNTRTTILRKVSFVDSPGHEMLMATMLSGAALMDGAILVIDATRPCPQPQTIEHLIALQIIGVRKIVIAQTKIDVVSREKIIENYNQIKLFVKNTIAENAPIIPVAPIHRVNIDALIEAIEKYIPTPDRDLSKPFRMYIARSFDVNKPGTKPRDLKGGVIGGTIIQGVLKIGDEIEIRPGLKSEKGKTAEYEPIFTNVVGLKTGDIEIDQARPGGLIGVSTLLDPSLTKADALVGNVAGSPGTLPPVLNEFSMEYVLFERMVGTKQQLKIENLKVNEPIMINSGTAVTLGTISSIHRGIATINLKRPICADFKSRVAISRRIDGGWRLIGYGIIVH